LEEKIAQLIMIRAHSDKNEVYNKTLIKQVEDYKVGGVCFFQGGPLRQASLTNSLQKASKIPLMISIDAEWGLAMRLDSVLIFPRQMALGATYDLAAIYSMGEEVARQCRRMGIHLNFAPCVDVNNNSKNPVIGSRSFGSNPKWVAQCGIAYAKGMQLNGVMACAKHFPGHGDTDTDSHDNLPVINHDLQQLRQTDLYPFRQLFRQGVDAVMIGHLHVPVLDSATNSIATLSPPITTDLLQKQMNFQGLIITDGLEMKGIADFVPTGELEVQTLIAGCDVLLLPGALNIVIPAIVDAVKEGRLSQSDIDRKCLKVLKMKEKYVLPNAEPIALDNLINDLNSAQTKKLRADLTRKSITVLQNKANTLPLSDKINRKTVLIRVDKSETSVLQTRLKHCLNSQSHRTGNDFVRSQTDVLFAAAKNADCLIVSLHNTSQYAPNQYGLSKKTIDFLDSLTTIASNTVLVVMSNPYCLNYIPFTDRFAAIVLAYHPTEEAEETVAKVICGEMSATGKLPIDLDRYPEGTGVCLTTKDNVEHHVHPALEAKIDAVVQNGISQQAFPGCRVLVCRKDKIIYNKSFGTFGYSDHRLITDNTLYDLASLTKIMATTLAMMKLCDEKKVDVKMKLSHYLPYLKNTDKEDMTIAQVMTHTAGLQAWLPFHQATLNRDKTLNPTIYSNIDTVGFRMQVCENLYIKDSYKDSILARIAASKCRTTQTYLYSDLGFYLLADLIERVSGKSLDRYVDDNFYRPMGLTHILFNPLDRFEPKDIAPTEQDTLFRKTLIHGYVHDQGAAMLGGVSGHAGLFSTADDLLAIAQMLLDKGSYKNSRYLSEKTIDFFTSYYFSQGDCRRGLGFDKPARKDEKSPCSKMASSSSYGHSGFTGTFIWIDPHYDLIYIFLSNRIHPDAENKKITQMNIRTEIQNIIYHDIN
jgi:beta-glucosidase-like glycosyl hydrolase/CubicO group peptidase (beta-lactamase class C family)